MVLGFRAKDRVTRQVLPTEAPLPRSPGAYDVEVLVFWRGRLPSESTWEPLGSVPRQLVLAHLQDQDKYAKLLPVAQEIHDRLTAAPPPVAGASDSASPVRSTLQQQAPPPTLARTVSYPPLPMAAWVLQGGAARGAGAGDPTVAPLTQVLGAGGDGTASEQPGEHKGSVAAHDDAASATPADGVAGAGGPTCTPPEAPAPAIARFIYGHQLTNPAMQHTPTRDNFHRAARHQQPGACLSDEAFKELTFPYIEWRESGPVLVDVQGLSERRASRAGFGSEHGRVVCRNNVRFLLGTLRLLGYAAELVSLEMFAVDRIMREMQAVMEGRRIMAGRRYQLYTELRTILWFVADRLGKAKGAGGGDRRGAGEGPLGHQRTLAPSGALGPTTFLCSPRSSLESYHFLEVCACM